jgi:hypothetical protein
MSPPAVSPLQPSVVPSGGGTSASGGEGGAGEPATDKGGGAQAPLVNNNNPAAIRARSYNPHARLEVAVAVLVLALALWALWFRADLVQFFRARQHAGEPEDVEPVAPAGSGPPHPHARPAGSEQVLPANHPQIVDKSAD